MFEHDRDARKNIILQVISGILVILSLVILYIANSKMPFKMDDEWYATNLVTGQPLSGPADIWESQVWHFFHWGGRNVAHAILQVVLWMGPVAADVLNVITTICLVCLICKLAGTNDIYHGLLTLGCLIVLNANWSQTLLWQSGAANYLYMTTLILAFLLCYFRVLEVQEGSGVKKLPGITFWIAPLGLMSGWSNENIGPAVWLGTLLVIFFVWKKSKKLQLWMIVGNLFCLVGSILVIIAPGNFVRSTEAAALTAGKGFLWKTFLRCFNVANGLFYYLLHALILFVLLLFVYCFVLGKRLRRTEIILIVMAVLSVGAMILSPHYPDRAAFGSMIFVLIPIIRMFAEIQRENKGLRLPAYGVVVTVWLGGMFPLCTYICQQIGWLQ